MAVLFSVAAAVDRHALMAMTRRGADWHRGSGIDWPWALTCAACRGGGDAGSQNRVFGRCHRVAHPPRIAAVGRPQC